MLGFAALYPTYGLLDGGLTIGGLVKLVRLETAPTVYGWLAVRRGLTEGGKIIDGLIFKLGYDRIESIAYL